MLQRQQQAIEKAQHEQQLAAAVQRKGDQQDAAAGGVGLTAADTQVEVQMQHTGSAGLGQMDMQEAKAAVKVCCSASCVYMMYTPPPLFSAQRNCQDRANCTKLAACACILKLHKFTQISTADVPLMHHVLSHCLLLQRFLLDPTFQSTDHSVTAAALTACGY
jgi:hypothetical protein